MKFSVIVPGYNVAQYLRECLDSLLAQTCGDWEAICIDDGSTDGSGAILDEYSQRDARIRVVHQTNAGVCRARQVGLEAATGEYVTWCDPDDTVAPDYLQFVADLLARRPDVDLAGFDFTIVSADGEKHVLQPLSADWRKNVRRLLDHSLHGSTCNKVVRRRFLADNGIAFADRRVLVCEDMLFVYALLLRRPCTVGINKSFYHYRTRTGSISRSVHGEPYYASLKYVGDEMLRLAPDDDIRDAVIGWQHLCKFEVFKHPLVSNAFYGDYFPLATDPGRVRGSWLHKLLFKLSLKGGFARSCIMAFFTLCRLVRGTNGSYYGR